MQPGTRRTALSLEGEGKDRHRRHRNHRDEDETEVALVRETNSCLLRSQYKEPGGEVTLQGGDDMLRDLKCILEGKGSAAGLNRAGDSTAL